LKELVGTLRFARPTALTVIGAKQSNPLTNRAENWIASSLLAMTMNNLILWFAFRAQVTDSIFKQPNNFRYASAISRRDAPEPCMNPLAQENRGRGECRVPMHPQPRVRNK
jgi:hypothetical protein